MRKIFNKRIQKAGLPPGSLLASGTELPSQSIKVSLICYNEETCIERNNISLKEALEQIDTSMMSWIQVYGVSDPQTISDVGKYFRFHPLVTEDIFNTGQRSKIDIYQEQLFIVVRSLHYQQETDTLQDEQVSLVFGQNFLVSFVEGEKDNFEPIRERLRQKGNRIRSQGSDYLAYSLLDTIVDYYFLVLEKVDANLDHLEEELLNAPHKGTVKKIQHAKRNMIILRRAIWPTRDVVSRFLRLENLHITPSTQVYMHDVYDHIVQIIDVVEGFRDVVSGMMDVYLSNINIRTNEIMRVLTIVSTIFVPLTFISSVYGMNFTYMPELQYHLAYPICLLFMASVALFMLFFFYRKKWI